MCLQYLYRNRTVTPSKARRTYAVSVPFITESLLFGCGTIFRTQLNITVNANETDFAKTIAISTFSIKRTVVTSHNDVAGIETLDFIKLFIVNGKKAGFCLNCDWIIRAFCAIDTEKLTLMTSCSRNKSRQAIVNINAVFLTANIYVFVNAELNYTFNSRSH